MRPIIDYSPSASPRTVPLSEPGVVSSIVALLFGMPLSVLLVWHAVAPMDERPLGLSAAAAPYAGCFGMLACAVGLCYGIVGTTQRDRRRLVAYVGVVGNAMPLLVAGGRLLYARIVIM